MMKIKKCIFKFSISVVVLALITGCATSGSKDQFKLRDHREIVLKNGLKVLFINDTSLPYFSLNLMMATGGSSDPKGYSGLAQFVGELLLKGTRKKSAIAFADELGHLGADMNISVSQDLTTMSASVLSFHQDKMLKLFSEALLQPAFSRSEFDRLKKVTIAGLRKQVDHPEAFSQVAFSKYLYSDHYYSRSTGGKLESVERFQQKNVNRFYFTHYRPNGATLAVVGKLAPNIEEQIRQHFSSWQSKDVPKVAEMDFPLWQGRQFRLVEKKGLKQAQVMFGMPGIRRSNPDYLAIRVANTILGGAFASRLNDRIREELGLTYGIYSYFSARKQQGPFVISTSTRNEKVSEMINEVFRLFDLFHAKGVSEEEVKMAVGYMKGQFPRNIETAESLAYNLQYLNFHGQNEKYLSNFIRDINRLKASDVNRVIKKYFKTDTVKVFVYAEKSQVLSQMQSLGSVEVVNFRKALN